MPTYAYRCKGCGQRFEQVESVTEHGKTQPRCPKCGAAQVESVPVPFFAKTSKKS